MKLIPHFCALVLCVASFSAHAVSSLKISGSYTERVGSYRDPDIGVSYFITQTGMASFMASVPLEGVDINSFDDATQIGFSLGEEGGGVSLTLGDDYHYVKGKKSVSYILTDFDPINPDKIIVVGRFTASWTATSLTINATATRDAFGFREKYGNPEGTEEVGTTKIYDAVPASVTLGEYSVSRTVYIKGQNTATHQRVGGADFPEDFYPNSGTFTGEADFTAPVVTILTPAANKVYKDPTNTVVFSGNAQDNAAFSDIGEPAALILRWNNGDEFYRSPLERTNRFIWQTDPLDLAAGTNTLTVYAIDESGNYSKPVSRSIFYSVPATLTLITNGPGGITGLKNGAVLEIGRGYKVTAVPKTGKVLLNWTDGDGNIVRDTYSLNGFLVDGTTSSTLNFVPRADLTLEANFGDSPFGPATGNFNGLFSREPNPDIPDDIGVSPDSAGYISVMIGSKGAYTAKAMAAGKTFSWSGQFFLDQLNNQAYCQTPIAHVVQSGYASSGLTYDIIAALSVDLASGTLVTGVIRSIDSSYNVLSDSYVQANRAQYTTNPVAGVFNFEIPGSFDDASIAPGGFHYGTVTISKTGGATVALNLADGSPMTTFSTFVAADGTFPIYASGRRGHSVFLGWANFPSSNSVQGIVNWVAGYDSTTKFYPYGFAGTNLTLAGVRFVAPKAGVSLLDWTDGFFEIGGGNLDDFYYDNVTFNKNAFTFPTLSRASLRLTPTTGAISGTVPRPGGGTPISFTGILLPSTAGAEFSGRGYGYFKGTNQTGYIWIHPNTP